MFPYILSSWTPTSVILNEVKDLFNKNVTECPYLWIPAYYVILMPQIIYFCSSVAAERFGSNQKSRTFALPFGKRVAERPGVLGKFGWKVRKIEKFWIKIWRFKNNAYLCIPVRKTGLERGTTSSLKRLITVQEASTEKYNLSRSVNSFEGIISVSDKLRII